MEDVNEKHFQPKQNQYSHASVLASLMVIHTSKKKASPNCSEIRKLLLIVLKSEYPVYDALRYNSINKL